MAPHFLSRCYLTVAALAGFSAVALGAFGAHALKNVLSASMLQVYQTAVAYQFYHLAPLLAVALMLRSGAANRWLSVSGACFILGMLIFSGTLYTLAMGGPRWIGMITPIGGVTLLIGWLLLLIAAWQTVELRESDE